LSHLRAFFDVVRLPAGGPVHLAVALPGKRLLGRTDFPAAARPDTGRVASGRGLDAASCEASALGEAAELVSCCAWGHEELITAREDELGGAALSPETLNGWTDAQLRGRAAWNRAYGDYDWRPHRRDPRRPIDWLRVEDAFGGPHAYAPADFAFIGRKRSGDPAAVAIGDSNGCASGSTQEAARLAALLELVERDATGRWWYARRRRPSIDLAALEDKTGLVAWLCERRRRTWLFDISSDLAIPVLAAASAEPDGRDVALGFAARIEAREAATAALTEMAQMEASLAAARALGDSAGSWAKWRCEVRIATLPLDATRVTGRAPETRSGSSGSPLSIALAACRRNDIGVWFASMTRPDLGTDAARAIAPALCHYKPRLARARLLAPDRPTGQSRRVAFMTTLLRV
jgi:ribosomal protein S12 methylthiotransferase accessory factor